MFIKFPRPALLTTALLALVVIAGFGPAQKAFAENQSGLNDSQVSIKNQKVAIASQSDGIQGVWLTKLGKSHLKIKECGPSLCDEIVWLREPNDSRGRPHTDKLNKNPALRTRPIIGMSILLKMKKIEPGFWRGWIYDPERGKAYQGYVRMLNNQKLEVQGCLAWGPPFCETHIWKKVRDLEAETTEL